MRVREGAPGDAAGVARLLADLGFPADEPAVRARLAAVRADARVLVAEDAGTLAGAVASHRMPVLDDDRPVCLVTVLVVAPGMRRRGVGRLLMEVVERDAREAGCGRVVVGTAHHRTSAHAFFRTRGYDDTGLRFQKALR
jgi:N-acetylglutamate synthase-like GNAT family acetyltransferase